MEQADQEKDARIAALEVKLASTSPDDDDTNASKSQKGANSPNGGSAVKLKAPPSQDAAPKTTKRFL